MEESEMTKTNLNTELLKIIACLAMLFDHVGGVFFPQYPIFRWIGRIAFPLFCYCLTVGMLYTHNIKKYLLRLFCFAVVSQPFYLLAFHLNEFMQSIFDLNIFFTLFICLLAVWGLKEKKWWLYVLCIAVIGLGDFDYSADGIILVTVFYLCRNKPLLGAALCVLNYIAVIFTGSAADPLSPVIFGHAVGFEIFSLFALPLIYAKGSYKHFVSKWVFYVFYPAHLLVVGLIELV